MGGQDELLDKVSEWVETSGRALELRTARAMREGYPLHVNQSLAYADPETGKQREGDVGATYHWWMGDAAASLDVAIECKSGTNHPWVAFYDHRTVDSPYVGEWLLLNGDWTSDELLSLGVSWDAQEALTSVRAASHAMSALGKDSNNEAHNSMQQAMSFARSLAARNLKYVSVAQERKMSKAIKAAVAVVVTQAPLFDCELTSDGEVNLQPVDRFDVYLDLGSAGGLKRVCVRNEGSFRDLARGYDAVQSDFGLRRLS